jgi:Putative MetA-pathway of phenol degradation
MALRDRSPKNNARTAILLCAFCFFIVAAGQKGYGQGGCDQDACSGFGDLASQPKKTLMQWSYGTSFSGGPDLDSPLVTDRPDFTEASTTVGLGVAQWELGYTYTLDNDGLVQAISHSGPEALLRYGVLADWLEFRVVFNLANERTGGVTVDGTEDLYTGFKIGLTPQEGILPEMAIMPQMTVPTGSGDFSAGEVLPGLNWLYGWDINDFLSTGGSTQFNRSIDAVDGTAYTEWAQSWTVGYSLTERLGGYTEWFGFLPHSATSAVVEHYFDGGFTYLISDNVQWDIRGGVGLNDAADDYFVGSGFSFRFK